MFFVPYINLNRKDTTNYKGAKVDKAFYIDQKVNQNFQAKISKTWKNLKQQNFSLNSEISKSRKKWTPDYFSAISVSSSIEVLLGIFDLLDDYAGIFILLYSTKICYLMSLAIMGILYPTVVDVER